MVVGRAGATQARRPPKLPSELAPPLPLLVSEGSTLSLSLPLPLPPPLTSGAPADADPGDGTGGECPFPKVLVGGSAEGNSFVIESRHIFAWRVEWHAHCVISIRSYIVRFGALTAGVLACRGREQADNVEGRRPSLMPSLSTFIRTPRGWCREAQPRCPPAPAAPRGACIWRWGAH